MQQSILMTPPTPPTSFTDVKPDDKCSRAEIVTFLYRGRDL